MDGRIDDNEGKASNVNYETRVQFVCENLEFFGCNFEKWVVCLIRDKCSTNLKISKNFRNHLYVFCIQKLNLQVNLKIDNMRAFSKQLKSVL